MQQNCCAPSQCSAEPAPACHPHVVQRRTLFGAVTLVRSLNFNDVVLKVFGLGCVLLLRVAAMAGFRRLRGIGRYWALMIRALCDLGAVLPVLARSC